MLKSRSWQDQGQCQGPGPAQVAAVMPDVAWLWSLWHSVMPGFQLAGAYTHGKDGQLDHVRVMEGFNELLRKAPGTVLAKSEVAMIMGYEGKDGWRDHKNQLRGLLAPFYAFGDRDLTRLDDRAVAPAAVTRPIPSPAQEAGGR